MATHLATVGRIMELQAQNVTVRVTGNYSITGASLKGDRKSFADGYEMIVEMESNEPPERIKKYIRRAEDECFTIFALRNPIPVVLSTVVNGEVLE
jgi:hypothetical protein